MLNLGLRKERLKVRAQLQSLTLKNTKQARNLGAVVHSDPNSNSQIRTEYIKNERTKIVHAFIFSRLDYCNAFFTALPKKSVRQLWLIQNASARNPANTRGVDHITAFFPDLHT